MADEDAADVPMKPIRRLKSDESEADLGEARGAMFQTKKTVSQGMLDMALLTANASQLNLLILDEQPNRPILWTRSRVLIYVSIGLQILVALLLVLIGRMDYEPNKHQRKRDNRWIGIINDLCTCTVFLITVVNIFLAVFVPVDVKAVRVWSAQTVMGTLGSGFAGGANDTYSSNFTDWAWDMYNNSGGVSVQPGL